MRRLKGAEADLRRLERKERRSERRISARDRTVDRRLHRMEAARRWPVWPLVAVVIALNAVASGLAVSHMFWPDGWLGGGVLLHQAGQWEFVAYLFITCAVVSAAFIAYQPLVDLHRHLRLAMSWYVSLAIIATVFGMLMATLLRPVEDLEVDHVAVAWTLAGVAMAATAAAVALYVLSGLRGSRLPATRSYHIAMGALVTVIACALVVLSIVVVPAVDTAHDEGLDQSEPGPTPGEWNLTMTNAGLGLAIAGAVGVLFALPALAGAMAAEFLLERRRADAYR